jgi:hypothetical protein
MKKRGFLQYPVERQIAIFNILYPVGTTVRYWPNERAGEPSIGKISQDATILGTIAVAWIEESRGGPIALSHVEIEE